MQEIEKTAINDSGLAPTPKPEVKYGGNHINELVVSDFMFDFNTMYGPICHCLAAKSYFRSGRIFQNGGCRHTGFLKFRNVKRWTGQEGQYTSPCQIS